MITIIASRDALANTNEMYRRLKSHHAQGQKAYLMVSEQVTLQRDIDLLDALEAKALIGIKVKSFTSLSREVLERVGGSTKPVITDIGKHMVIRRIVDSSQKELSLFRHTKDNEGFITGMIRLITELKSNRVEPELLMQLLEREVPNPLFHKKITEIAIILERYNQLLEGKYIDNENRLMLLTEKLPDAHYIRDIHFYFDSYTSFSLIEWEVLEVLHAMGVSMTLCVTIDERLIGAENMGETVVKDAEVFDSSLRLYQRIEEMVGAKPKIHIVQRSRPPLYDVDWVSHQLFSYNPISTSDSDGSIRLFQGLNTEEEVEEVARNIRCKVIDEGYRFRDFTVVTAHPLSYNKILKRIFNQSDIPYFIDEKRSFLENSIVKFIISAIEMISFNMRQENVMGFLKSGFVDVTTTEALAFENYVNRRRIRGGMYFDEKYFSVDQNYYKKSKRLYAIALREVQEAWGCRERLLEVFLDFYDRAQVVSKVVDHCRSVYDFLHQEKLKVQFDGYQADLAQMDRIDIVDENNQVMGKIVEILEQLVEMIGEVEVSFVEFAKILKDGFSAMHIGLIPPAQDQVIIGSVMRSRNGHTPHLFLMGMNDAYLPSSQDEGGLLLPSEMEWLKENDVVLPSEVGIRQSIENISLYNTIGRATERLHLSYASMDSSNQSMQPATYLHQIRKILPMLQIETPNRRLNERDLYTPFLAIRKMLNLDREDNVPIEDRNLGHGIMAYMTTQDKWQQTANIIYESWHYIQEKPPLARTLARKLYDGPTGVSISRMERFASCPYKHFVDYGLRPMELNAFSIGKNEIGSVLHEVIDNFTSLVKEQEAVQMPVEEGDVEKFVVETFEKVTKDHIDSERRGSQRNNFVLQRTRFTALENCIHVLRQIRKGAFSLFKEEVAFGQKNLEGQLVFEVDGESVALEGVIDRIDRYRTSDKDFIRVIDYKSGNKTLDITSVIEGLDIQLIVYLNAAIGICSTMGKETVPAGVFYLPLNRSLIADTPVEGIEASIEKSYMMKGFLLKDEKVFRAMDDEYDINLSVFKFDGKVRDPLRKDNVLTIEQIKNLIGWVMGNVEENIYRIIEGDIGLEPFKNGDLVACKYCDNIGICKFDERYSNYVTISTTEWAKVKSFLDEGRHKDGEV